MALGCGASFAKIVLVIINFLFLLTGLAILGIGIWLYIDKAILKPVEFINVLVADESDLFLVASIFLMALGAFVVLVSLMGFIGACIENTVMLTVYIILLAIVFAGEVACGVVAIIYKDEIQRNVDSTLAGSLWRLTSNHWPERYYRISPTDNKTCSATEDGARWDNLQVQFECCGVHPDPFSGYERVDLSQLCPWLNLTHGRPVTCCKHKSEDLDDATFDLPTDDQLALIDKFDCSDYKKKGCVEAVDEWIEMYAPILIGIGFGVGMFELLVIIFAVCLCQHAKYKDDSDY